MKTKLMIAVLFFVTVLGAGLAAAQTASVKGKVIDKEGKPMVGATIEMTANETGRRYNLKTDAKGQFSSLGVAPGRYKVQLLNDGQVIDYVTNFPVTLGLEDNYIEFDIRKTTYRQEQQLTPEQKAAREAAVRETDKISGLNTLIKQSGDAIQAGKFDEAVQIMRQATATDASFDILWGRLCEADVLAGRQVNSSDRAKAQGYFEDAVNACGKAIAIKPAGAYHANLADASARLGKIDTASQQFGLAAQLDPPNAFRYFFNQGAVLTNVGKTDDANAAFDRAIAANPQYADAYYQKALNLMAKATVDAKGTMTAPPEVAANLNKYLELAPTGKDADTAKQLIETLGAKVETSFGKPGTRKK